MNIVIDSYKQLDGTSKVLGFANITIKVGDIPLTINGMKVIRGENGVFYAFPDKKIQDQEGQDKYVSICGVYDSDGNKLFKEAMNRAFNVWKEKNKEPVKPVVSDEGCPF